MKTKRSAHWIATIKKKKYAGVHLIAEFWNGKTIKNTQKIKAILTESAKRANNTPLKIAIHKFLPHGMTGVILLAESHIAIHSWPEFNYLAIDIFTCGDQTKPQEALKYLREEFKPKKIEVTEFKRGKLG